MPANPNHQSLIPQPLQRVIEHIGRDEMPETRIGDARHITASCLKGFEEMRLRARINRNVTFPIGHKKRSGSDLLYMGQRLLFSSAS